MFVDHEIFIWNNLYSFPFYFIKFSIVFHFDQGVRQLVVLYFVYSFSGKYFILFCNILSYYFIFTGFQQNFSIKATKFLSGPHIIITPTKNIISLSWCHFSYRFYGSYVVYHICFWAFSVLCISPSQFFFLNKIAFFLLTTMFSIFFFKSFAVSFFTREEIPAKSYIFFLISNVSNCQSSKYCR
jgi:hypothetical protein